MSIVPEVEGGELFDCWVSTLDGEIAMTELNLSRIKSDVLYSLVPLLLFIVSVLYAFCRLGVFAVCNPFRWCPKGRKKQHSYMMDNIHKSRYCVVIGDKMKAAKPHTASPLSEISGVNAVRGRIIKKHKKC